MDAMGSLGFQAHGGDGCRVPGKRGLERFVSGTRFRRVGILSQRNVGTSWRLVCVLGLSQFGFAFGDDQLNRERLVTEYRKACRNLVKNYTNINFVSRVEYYSPQNTQYSIFSGMLNLDCI